MVTEIWKEIPDFPGYEVSDLGRIRSFWFCPRKKGKGVGGGNDKPITLPSPQKIIRPSKDKGYDRYVLSHISGKKKNIGIGRLILSAFVGPCPLGGVARHLDGNPSHNYLSNFSWSTQKENLADCLIHGTRYRGEKHYRAKISEFDVKMIRLLHNIGYSISEISRHYPISRKAVGLIVHRVNWKHVI